MFEYSGINFVLCLSHFLLTNWRKKMKSIKTNLLSSFFIEKIGKQRENNCLIVEVAKITRNSNLLKII